MTTIERKIPNPAGDVDYRQFLARLDMTWEKLVHRGGRYYDNPVGTRRDWGEAAANGLYTIKLQAGDSVLLYSGETVPEVKVSPVASQRQFENFSGADPARSGTK